MRWGLNKNQKSYPSIIMKLNTPMPLKESSHYSQEEIQLDHHIHINAIDMIQTEIKDIKERIKKGEI